MALSGGHNSGGGLGGSYLRIEWSASQNYGNNTSTISAVLKLVLQGGTSIAATESGDINIDGVSYGYSRGSTSRGPNGTHTLHSASRTIGHNNDGTRSFSIGGSFNSGWGGFGSLGTGMGGYTLNTIPRYANITSWSLNTVTEKSINVSVNTDSTADLVDYSINGSGWTRGYTGNFTSLTFTISGLQPATAYSIKVRVRRQSSGLYTESGLRSATTNAVTITTATTSQATDTTLTINAITSHVADLLQYRFAGDTTWLDAYTGDFTDTSFLVSGLDANETYDFELRARHKDSGAYTPIKAVSGTTGDPQPLQPTNLQPTNAQGVDNLTPTLTWQYNSTSPDAQTAFQVIVRRQSDGVEVYDSGKIVSNILSHQIPASELVFNVAYQWQVRTWSGTDITGPYSETALFKTSQKPVVTITAPADDAIVQTSSPTINWTYSDPESTAQKGYRVLVKQIANTGETDGPVIVDQQNSNSDATTYTLPAEALANDTRYIVQVFATDSDGVTGESSSSEFYVEFVAPEPPQITVELSEDILFARATVSSNQPDDDAFEVEQFRIYRREVGESVWKQIATIQPTFAAIQPFEDDSGWTVTPGTASVVETENAKQGNAALSIVNTASGTTTVSKATGVGSVEGYDRIRVWVRAVDASDITSVRFRFGADSSNYYQFQVNGSSLADGVWHSVEVAINDLTIVGTPSLGNIQWSAVVVVATTALASDDLIVDGLRGIGAMGSNFAYDYRLANKHSYEYAASTYNGTANLESEKTIAGLPIDIVYSDWQNTYLIPVYGESQALIAFMEGNRVPNWQTQTDTSYYTTANGKYPVVYTRGGQKYRRGSLGLMFIDEKFGGDGLAGEMALREIMNFKPIMLRTWWGEIIYISIDGSLPTTRRQGVAWETTFNFTEIAPE